VIPQQLPKPERYGPTSLKTVRFATDLEPNEGRLDQWGKPWGVRPGFLSANWFALSRLPRSIIMAGTSFLRHTIDPATKHCTCLQRLAGHRLNFPFGL